jgi:DNA-binding protein HU-beta
MNKPELINRLAEQSGLEKRNAEVALKSVFEIITSVMSEQDTVHIPGFGRFETRERAAREGHNPSTGKKMLIPSAIVPIFKAASALKKKLNAASLHQIDDSFLSSEK